MLVDYLSLKEGLVQEYPAISNRFLGQQYFFSSVQIKTTHSNVRGFGIALDPRTSRKKAFYESVEWSALELASTSFNGSAAGPAWQDIRQRALFEAHERDTFIRWYTGQLSPYKISEENMVMYKFILSLFGGILCVALLKEGYKCIPFGLGFSKTELLAKHKAENELVMSLFRHASEPCERVISDYNQLHQLTTLPAVRKRLLNKNEASEPDLQGTKRELNSSAVHFRLVGIHRWPTIVCALTNNDLLMWDLDEFKKPVEQSKFSSILLNEELGPHGIPTG